MNNQNLVRGLLLMLIASVFGGIAIFNYKIGSFATAGPGLFPLMISGIVFFLGVLTLVRTRFVEAVPLKFNYKNISIILLSLCGFTLISQMLGIIVGIIFLVFCASFASTSYSIIRNCKVSIGLIGIAFAFKYFLGLNLALYPWTS